VAALYAWRSCGHNAVFCEAPKPAGPKAPSTGTRGGPPVSGRAIIPIAEASLHDGTWRAALAASIAAIPPFEELATFEFWSLQGADIAASMGIVSWLESLGPTSLRKFHDVLRKRAPEPPARILATSAERALMYEEAFQAASGLGTKAADRAWREWIVRQ
jgi:hypothetical protein